MSASIGVSIAPIDGNDFDTLYQKADAALYQTKQRGKNGYTIA
jgi:GGDEF domain-containing protein